MNLQWWEKKDLQSRKRISPLARVNFCRGETSTAIFYAVVKRIFDKIAHLPFVIVPSALEAEFPRHFYTWFASPPPLTPSVHFFNERRNAPRQIAVFTTPPGNAIRFPFASVGIVRNTVIQRNDGKWWQFARLANATSSAAFLLWRTRQLPRQLRRNYFPTIISTSPFIPYETADAITVRIDETFSRLFLFFSSRLN